MNRLFDYQVYPDRGGKMINAIALGDYLPHQILIAHRPLDEFKIAIGKKMLNIRKAPRAQIVNNDDSLAAVQKMLAQM
jgi:hypothetical protein